jgi:DNA replication protein DnaC
LLTFDKDPHIVAPAEKNKLCSLLTDKTIEALAFPHLFPDGHGTYNEERETVLQWKEYCKARLFSSDPRFGGDSSYIFFLQYVSDLKQVFSSINVAFRKKVPLTAKQSLDESQMKFLLNKDMIYRHLQCVRGSPQFRNQRLKQLFGMSRQLDFNQLFLTFSCADLRWKEFPDTFVRYTGGTVKESYTFEEKTHLLRACPVVAARMFERRFNTFMNLFVKGGAWCLGKVIDWFVRIEMQLRGSPHAHLPLWVADAPKYKGTATDEATRAAIVNFCDKYITTHFPSLIEDRDLHFIIKEVQTHSRNHSKSCLKCGRTLCRFGFPRPISRQTFICEPIKNIDRTKSKKIREILTEMNITLNALETQKVLSWTDFESLLEKYKWTYDNYEYGLRAVHTRAIIIHRREPNARWVNQYNEELLRAWNANMDIQFVLDPYACAKYLMSYTTKPEREMSLLLETTHKECREGNLSVREEMKKLTGTFFNHRQVSVQESIYRATKMPLTYCSRGFVFVPAHSGSCRFLKPAKVLKQMDPDDVNIYMSNLADKYFDRPMDDEFNNCMADFASEYEIISVKRNVKNPKTAIRRLQTLNFAVKKRCNRQAIIRFPYFNRQTDKENYYENLLCLYLPIRSRDELKKPYELFYQTVEVFDKRHEGMRKVKDIVQENQRKYEAHFKETEEVESILHDLSKDAREDDWAAIVAKKGTNDVWSKEIVEEDNPDFNRMHNKKNKGAFIDLKQTCGSTDEMRPLLDSMNEEQQDVFYRVRQWCTDRLHNPETEPLRLFITGGAGTGKSHLLKCLHYEATKIFSRKKHLEPDENINEIHTLITAFTGAAAVNVGGMTIHSAFGIGSQQRNLNESLSSEKLNTYRCKLGTLKLLFVDEVSLIQADLWGAMHSRLTQIMAIQSNSIVFGSVGIIAIGDFYQCSPVASSSIYSSLLWTDHFEYVELTVNERQKTNKCFSQMLNRIRKLKRKEQLNEEDRLMLQKCHQRYLDKEYHPESLHLFARNAQVDQHNEMMIKKICTDIRTFDELDRNDKQWKPYGNRKTKEDGKVLRLARNARVMITKNISVNDGLANGVVGRIVSFVENEKNEVSRIVIQCDSPKIGRIHRLSCPHCQAQNTVCVGRESNTIDRFDFESESKKGCKQFPLRLSWAMTIHKAQGITVDEVVVSTKDLFGSGMGYTALSRVRTLNGLFLIDLHLDKFYCHEKVDRVLSQMREMKKEASTLRDSSDFINILFHNVEGLKCNFSALKNHRCTQRANLICLVETWLTDHSRLEELLIDGYHLLHKPRSASFACSHPLQKQKGGGVAMYVQDNVSSGGGQFYQEPNLEYLRFDIEKNNITIITCYRSPQQRKKEFIEKVQIVLKRLSSERKILLIGDFNEDTFNGKERSIERQLEGLGFVNMYKGISTTNSLSSLDCVYANFVLSGEAKRHVTGTYFSFHDALTFSVNLLDKHLLTKKDIHNNDDIQIDVDKPTDNSSVAIEVPQLTNKRKRQSKERTSTKVLRSTTDASAPCTSGSSDLKRKQLLFLENHKEIREKNCQENSSGIVQLDEQLAAIGFKKKKMPGDGNCFFRAISYQLHRHENEHLNIRSTMISYLIDNIADFVPYIDDDYANPDDYIDQMCRTGTYADHIAVLATAIVIKKNIVVHQRHHRPMLVAGSDFIDHQVHVCYNAQTEHYDTTIPVDNYPACISPEDMLLT